jgi:hypothetical protein
LRGLVQMLGGLVDGVGGAINVFADLPGPVQIAIGALAAWAVAGGKMGGVVDAIQAKMQAFRETQEMQRALFAMQQRDVIRRGQLSDLGSSERAGGQLVTSGDRQGRPRRRRRRDRRSWPRRSGRLAAAAGAYVLSAVIDSLTRMANAGDDAKKEIAISIGR